MENNNKKRYLLEIKEYNNDISKQCTKQGYNHK